MATGRLPDLSLTEWAVLALVAESPTHGFAVAKTLAADGDVGRVWTVHRPLVYRALATLEQAGLVESLGAEAGNRGPARTRLRATRKGRSAVDRWLETPVGHVRDLRTQLLLQLKMLDRRCRDAAPLASAQLECLAPILSALRRQAATATGFDRLLASWRYESADAAARVLAGVLADRSMPVPSPSTTGRGGRAGTG
jgi:DNA-binding PadR family transcriptional regulator